MKAFAASTTINAPAATIWSILIDVPNYPQWDPGVDRVEGIGAPVEPGSKFTIYTKLSPGRAFPVTATEYAPERAMVWSGGMPLGLFKGRRTFTLSPKGGEGAVEVTLREEFTGPLAPLIGKSIPDLTPTFAAFLAALKARAERQ